MKWSIMVPLSISSVSCGFGHIYWRNPSWKTSFFVQCHSSFIAIPCKSIKQTDKILGTHVRLPLKLLQSHWICNVFFLIFKLKRIANQVSVKMMFRHIMRYMQQQKVTPWTPATLSKRDSSTGVSLWILGIF